ncbi:MAG: hypothetical protein E7554_03670 [Ruminococcaceae bacterium]|nr:hypothetical protein [Oscillospiraceae bacterium]
MLSDVSVFLRGSCRFTATGDFPERFLNLCARSDMGLWDIRRTDGGVSARVIAGRYRLLLPCARRCGVRLSVTRRYGLPFRLLPYRRRPGMPLGFLLFCGTLWFLSLFIWSVRLPVLSPEVSTELEQALDDMGVSVGSLRSEVDGDRMSIELQMRVPDLTWAGISTFGSSVTVEAKEYEPVAIIPKVGEPCNLIAARDGIILDIDYLRGEVEVQPGQAVVKGDLLVSGVVEHLDGSVQITEASAAVWARTTHRITCTIPYRQTITQRTGRLITRHRVRLFSLELPLLSGIDTEGLYEREYSEWHLTVGTMELPFEVRTERCYEQEQIPVEYTPEQAEQLAAEELERRAAELDCAEIIDSRCTFTQGEHSVTAVMELTVKEDIASPSPIGIQ